MKKALLLSFYLLLFACFALQAQTSVQIGTGTEVPANTLYSPVYRYTAGSSTTGGRSNILFTQAEMAAAGIPAGAIITSVEFHKRTTGSFLIPASYKMYMANTNNTSLATTLTWASVLSTHTEVYSNTAFNVPSSIGWVSWTVTPFTYTGGALEIAQEHTMTGGATGADNNFAWEYTAGSADKVVGASSPTAATLNGTVAAYKHRPNIKITYILSTACSGMPVAGTVVASSTQVCLGESFTLSTTGSTSASGITYQWQSSPDSASWTNIPSATNPALVTTQTATSYYRVRLACAGDTANSGGLKITSPLPVSGVFTINAAQPTGGSNFNNFTDAINHIKCGINGPVVFNVQPASGPYNEQVIIPAIGGTSSTNTITINGNGETLNWNAPDANNRVALTLNGADYVTIDSLMIDVSQSTFSGWGIGFTGGADYNIVRKCTITANNSSTSSAYSGIMFNGSLTTTGTSSNAGNYNKIIGNTIVGGYYGIYLYGNSSNTTINLGNQVLNNVVRDVYGYGIYGAYQSEGFVVSGNDVSRPTRTTSTTMYGIYVGAATVGALIEKNRIHNAFDAMPSSTSTFYGIYLSTDATITNPTRVINNMIYTPGGNGAAYGIANAGSDYANIFHNTIAIDDAAATSGAAYGFYQTTAATSIVFRNNIVTVSRPGTGAKRVLYFATTTSAIVSNNNVLYLLSTGATTDFLGQFGTTNFLTLADWKTANGAAYDQSSVSIDPLFTNASMGEYLPTEAAVNGIGGNVGVTHDILDSLRTVTAPDPGAYEFTISGTDADISWIAPATAGITPGNKTITVNITNTQTTTITSVNLSYTDGTNVVSQNFTSLNLLAGQSQQLNFSQQYNMTASIRLRAYINTVNGNMDGSQLNDTTATQLFCLPMSGTYTINNNMPLSATNFPNLQEAFTQLVCSGITAPVILNIEPGSGPYTDAVTIPPVPGASAANKITIRGNGTTLSYNTSNANARTAIVLNGADHIIIDSLIVDVSASTTAGWAIAFTNAADSNVVRNCTILASTTQTTTNYMGIVFNGSLTTTASSSNAGNYNKILNNTITGGYYGLYLYGNSASASQNIGNEIRGNKIYETYLYGIYAIYQSDSLVISANEISRPTRATVSTGAGVYLTTNSVGALVEKNRIYNLFGGVAASTSTGYGIYVGTDGLAAKPNRIQNNLIYNINTNGSAYGIYNSGSDHMLAYHNTISLDETNVTTGAGYGIYQTTAATGIEIRNNVISITRSGTGTKRALHFNTTGSTIISNNNGLFMNAAGGTNNHLGQHGTVNFTTLTDWKTAASGIYDQQSVADDPMFVSAATSNYEPTSSIYDNLGTPAGVLTDIKDSLRSTVTPDPGAYEFSTITTGLNMAAVNLVTPTTSAKGCYSSAETISVRIRNASNATIDFAVNPVTVTAVITGTTTQTISTVLNTGTLMSDSLMVVQIPTPVNMSVAGSYTIDASTNVAGDVNTANDAMPSVVRTREMLTVGAAQVSPDSYCSSASSLPKLSTPDANGYTGLQWRQSTSAASGYADIPGATSPVYQLTSAPTQAMYYKLMAVCASESDSSSPIALSYINPQVLSTTPDTTCGTGFVTLQATASAGATIRWYDTPTGGTELGTGNSFNTPVISTTTNYYVSAGEGAGSSGYVGAIGTSIGTISSYATDFYYLTFDVLIPTTILTVDVYPTAPVGTTAKIEILDNAGAVLNTVTYTTTVTGGNVQTVVMNVPLPPGTNYRMKQGTGAGNNIALNRNTTGANFPYTSPSINITGHNFSGYPQYYYFFYNWQFTSGCESARTAVQAYVDNTPGCSTVPVTGLVFKGERKGTTNQLSWSTITEINNAGFELQSSVDGINFGKFAFVGSKAEGGNSAYPLSYAYDHVNAPQATMYYRLKQVDKDGRSTYSNVVVIKAARSAEMLISSLYPNPATDKVNMVLSAPAAQKVQVLVTDLTGRAINTRNLSLISGDNNIQLDIASLPQGSYFVKVVCSNGCESAVRKFVK